MKAVMLLDSIHQVMRAEKLLKGEGMKVDLIPVPREISSDCGMALELPVEYEREAIRVLEKNRMPVREWYARDQEGAFQKRER
jgi:hypothetical protein